MQYLIFLILFFSIQAWPCAVPIEGDEINNKIILEKIGTDNYKITVPKKMKHLDYGIKMSLIYYKNDDKFRVAKEHMELSPMLQGGFYIAQIKIYPIKDLIPYISVVWEPEFCCLCPAFGRSIDINL